MHMADALISPAVGGAMWTASAALIGYSAKKVQQSFDDIKIPMMGALGAFIFAAQMINFTIPATGSSGHLGGGMILAILLGPHAAFLSMASVLTIQAVFFADGGLLALGCNIFNLGFFPCFVVYPLIYKKIAGNAPTKGKITTGSIISAIIGLQLGAFGVVLETIFSGISELPFAQFVLLMQPIHLAIGFVEGIATAAVVLFIWQARPEIFASASPAKQVQSFSIKPVILGLIAVTVLTGGIFSWFASTHPDGLEWAMFKTSGKEELETPEHSIYSSLATLQEKTAVLPDYTFKKSDTPAEEGEESWPAVDQGTSFSGLIGGAIVFLIAMGIGFGLRRKKGFHG
jgi:cobalt/nickel transport system permease protein